MSTFDTKALLETVKLLKENSAKPDADGNYTFHHEEKFDTRLTLNRPIEKLCSKSDLRGQFFKRNSE